MRRTSRFGHSATAASTNVSESARGISVSAVTARSKVQNGCRPTISANGSRAARRATIWSNQGAGMSALRQRSRPAASSPLA